MRDTAIVAFAQTDHVRHTDELSEVEMLMPVLHRVLDATGLKASDIGFTCSGSSDYLAGRAFSFTMALDGVGAYPPISESHVEMDGAWALYEAWVKIQTGQADTALVYSYGKSSPGEVRDVLTRQLDPYYVGPLWPDSVALAALQARALIDAGDTDEAALAAIAHRSRAAAADNPHAQLGGPVPAGEYVVRPLRTGDCPPVGDGAAAVILAAGDTARALCPRPAWIRGIDHRIEAHSLGVRELTESPSTRLAATRAGVFERPVDTAELHAPFTSQEVVLRKALRLDDSVDVNPSGGALAANPVMAAGLIRLGEAAARIHRGESDRALAHATSGPCLQQNLVAVLEGESAHVQ
ncbi:MULTISPECIES: thiolase domain-containing protein [unclassified Streptomyces]|uniref:thiolase domain-containing protein n=1 Tax=unclassified Streptomyces TaxID=2593676 RepID=UPI00224FB970|nr:MULTISPECIES: thiolase domain-containing protein [unclassified Streptomyces]WTB52226.1 thiolase domain-containing protein [Streptomyces sp. NBC_00826]WTH94883.1 thiolase domain-containing protein [Streptomyces sp. NBC_00825]WTI03617.1 thiolase domain-containing protein [Streptomyces sp. NBC_00822]MCX4869184.1 thiolase domain-containing protein [Streptomyces sp. NBC_00906]MCX4900422.1 thiolase domain-containing protein [Streptomyces sp. NBC_00892]